MLHMPRAAIAASHFHVENTMGLASVKYEIIDFLFFCNWVTRSECAAIDGHSLRMNPIPDAWTHTPSLDNGSLDCHGPPSYHCIR